MGKLKSIRPKVLSYDTPTYFGPQTKDYADRMFDDVGGKPGKFKIIVVLEALLRGGRIEFDGYEWVLDSGFVLRAVAHDAKGNEHYVGTDFYLSQFLVKFNEMTTDEILQIVPVIIPKGAAIPEWEPRP